MLVYLLRRLGQSLLVLLAVSFVAFLVFRYIGDPTLSLLGEAPGLKADRAGAETAVINNSLGECDFRTFQEVSPSLF